MIDRELLQKLFQYGVSLTKNADDSHDLLQSAIEKWIKQGKPIVHLSAYLRKTMRNLFIDECRRKNIVAFEPLVDDQSNIAELHADENVLEKELVDSDMVQRLSNQLNAAENETLFLWAVMEYSASEIAVELSQARGTVLSRLHRIKQKIRQLMSSEEFGSIQQESK